MEVVQSGSQEDRGWDTENGETGAPAQWKKHGGGKGENVTRKIVETQNRNGREKV